MEMSTLNATSPNSIDFDLNKSTLLKCKVTISAATMVAALATIASPLYLDASEQLFCTQIPFCSVVPSNIGADETIPYADRIQKVLDFYALGKTHLCKIVNVTRPALYAWIEGHSEPTSENFKKIEILYTYAKNLMKNDDDSLYRGFVERAFSHYHDSLFDLFVNNSDLSQQTIEQQISDAFQMSIERRKNIESRRNRSFKVQHSFADNDLNLEANL